MQQNYIMRWLVFKILGARNPQHSCGISGDVGVNVKAVVQADGLERHSGIKPLLAVNWLSQRPVDMPATARVDDGRLRQRQRLAQELKRRHARWLVDVSVNASCCVRDDLRLTAVNVQKERLHLTAVQRGAVFVCLVLAQREEGIAPSSNQGLCVFLYFFQSPEKELGL